MKCNLLLALSIVSSAIVNMNLKAVCECIIQSLAAALFDECGALMVILRHDTEECAHCHASHTCLKSALRQTWNQSSWARLQQLCMQTDKRNVDRPP